PSAACNAAIRRQGCEPVGLIWKTAIHCVVALGNNLLLPAHHALCLAIFQTSDEVKRHGTGSKQLCLRRSSRQAWDSRACTQAVPAKKRQITRSRHFYNTAVASIPQIVIHTGFYDRNKSFNAT
ncbi:hypothetical protein, partial [Chitinimonas sp. JJ19]|uniref:hypothetical protein n=1 Tax=Chitinimonas sp. JJ19 TaxID=3109352 RepID=UPI0030035004